MLCVAKFYRYWIDWINYISSIIIVSSELPTDIEWITCNQVHTFGMQHVHNESYGFNVIRCCYQKHERVTTCSIHVTNCNQKLKSKTFTSMPPYVFLVFGFLRRFLNQPQVWIVAKIVQKYLIGKPLYSEFCLTH
jgi:hypothetical protein